jgi:BirA family biotin operon repressor/biotin-[acetyl-CoA-carboxylase] ligase
MMRRDVLPDLARAKDAVAARGGALGRVIHLCAETESTNDDAKGGARAGEPHGATWVAERQTRGRGRQGRTWLAARGESLLFSVLLRISCPPSRVPPLSLVAGLAVRDAVARALGDDAAVEVKWPNDVLVRRKKIAGILVESAVAGSRVEYVVIGIGINVHVRALPPEIASIATSLALEGAPDVDRAALLADVLARLDHDVEHVAHRGLGLIHARLSKHDALKGREVDVEGVRGVASGIDPDGRLLVRRPGGELVRVAAGEVLTPAP